MLIVKQAEYIHLTNQPTGGNMNRQINYYHWFLDLALRLNYEMNIL